LRNAERHGDGMPRTHIVIHMHGVDELHDEFFAKNYRYMNPGINQVTFSEAAA
jgi:Glyoxalase superfamily protein